MEPASDAGETWAVALTGEPAAPSVETWSVVKKPWKRIVLTLNSDLARRKLLVVLQPPHDEGEDRAQVCVCRAPPCLPDDNSCAAPGIRFD